MRERSNIYIVFTISLFFYSCLNPFRIFHNLCLFTVVGRPYANIQTPITQSVHCTEKPLFFPNTRLYEPTTAFHEQPDKIQRCTHVKRKKKKKSNVENDFVVINSVPSKKWAICVATLMSDFLKRSGSWTSWILMWTEGPRWRNPTGAASSRSEWPADCNCTQRVKCRFSLEDCVVIRVYCKTFFS